MCIRDRFVLALIGIFVLQRKGTSFGNLVIIGTIVGAILGVAIQVIAGFPDDPTKVVYIKESTKWFSLVAVSYTHLDVYKRQGLLSSNCLAR